MPVEMRTAPRQANAHRIASQTHSKVAKIARAGAVHASPQEVLFLAARAHPGLPCHVQLRFSLLFGIGHGRFSYKIHVPPRDLSFHTEDFLRATCIEK